MGGMGDFIVDDEVEDVGKDKPRDTKAYNAEGPAKNWRACNKCRLLLTMEQFMRLGCPNCPELLFTEEEAEYTKEKTTDEWSGMLSHLNQGGWLKRAVQIPAFYAYGNYAIQITPKEDFSASKKQFGKPKQYELPTDIEREQRIRNTNPKPSPVAQPLQYPGAASASGAGKISAARVAVDVQQQQQGDEEEDDLMEESGANRSTGGVFDLY